MRWMILAGALLAPIAANAQCCAWTGGSTVSICSNCVSDAPKSFNTAHKWVVTTPGTLTLEGTGFTISVDQNKLVYDLRWRGSSLLNSNRLSDCEDLGVARAVDLQAIGAPLQ